LTPSALAVILGTAMGGEMHYITTMRVQFPEYRSGPGVGDAVQAIAAGHP
jgi:hypothetical protein